MKKKNSGFRVAILSLIYCFVIEISYADDGKIFQKGNFEDIIPRKIEKMSQLAPLLGKRIEVNGLIIYGENKGDLPHILLYGNPKLRVLLGFNDGRKGIKFFFKTLKLGFGDLKMDHRRYAVISGLLLYCLTDMELEKNKKLKEDILHWEYDFPMPSKYGDLMLLNPEVIEIIKDVKTDNFKNFLIKQIPLSTEDNKEKNTRFIDDGNMEKFNEYIEHLKKENN